jgi:hypothetical protein
MPRRVTASYSPMRPQNTGGPSAERSERRPHMVRRRARRALMSPLCSGWHAGGCIPEAGATRVRRMATEEELQQAWINTRLAVLQAIDAQVGSGKVSTDNASQALDLAEAYAWLTRPDQAHGKGA